VYARWRRRPVTLLIGGSAAALGVGFAIMTVAPTLLVAVIGAFLGGAGNSLEWVAARTAVQERTPDRWMALMMSLTDSMSQLAPGLGILLGGVIAALTSSRAAFGVASVGSLLFAVAVPFALRHEQSPALHESPAVPPSAEEPEEEITHRRKSLV
jgi:MFS family permease